MATVFRPLDSNWQLIGSGPMVIQVRGGTALIAVGDDLPDPDDVTNCFWVSTFFSYTGSQNVYARWEYDPPSTDVGLVVDVIS